VDEAQSSGLSEDDAKRKRDEAEKLVKETNQEIEDLKSKKEQDLMTI
jgi:ribosome recycling factor